MSEEPLIPEAFSCDGRKIPVNICVTCGYTFDCASDIDNNREQRAGPHDFTVCLNCGEIYVFDENMVCRVPTLEQLMAAQRDRELWAMLTKTQGHDPTKTAACQKA